MRATPCPGCGATRRRYSEKWDAYYCTPCNRWLERACSGGHDGCDFNCGNRPDVPLATCGCGAMVDPDSFTGTCFGCTVRAGFRATQRYNAARGVSSPLMDSVAHLLDGDG